MRALANSLLAVLVLVALFWGNCFSCPQLLIASLPSLTRKDELRGIPGLPPSLLDRPSGCAFRARCPHSFDRCAVEEPALIERRPSHWAACHLLDGGREER